MSLNRLLSCSPSRLLVLAVLCVALLQASGCVQPLVVPTVPAVDVVPTFTPTVEAPGDEGTEATAIVELASPTETPAESPAEPPAESPVSQPQSITVALAPSLSEADRSWLAPLVLAVGGLETEAGLRPVELLDQVSNAQITIDLAPFSQSTGTILYERYYAAVVPFATVDDGTTMDLLAMRWRGEDPGGLVVALEHQTELQALLGPDTGSNVQMVPTADLLSVLEANAGAIGLLPFDALTPRYKVLTVDGFNVLSNRFNADGYPLAVEVSVGGTDAQALAAVLAEQIPAPTNRNGERLTTLIMTGVTAMSRVTALRMEQRGYDYPALIISDTLAAADITHISNEVPFLDDCVVDASENNLILCSHTNYWATLEAVGTDIVGLSGNHVNDFGRDGAIRSITWYRDNGIPIYGSGMNIDEACAPLIWEHNGNRFAFIAALAFEPQFAWATEDQPGTCYYYHHKQRLFDMIAELRPQVDIIAVELQYLETYNPYPTDQQVIEFRELRDVGVDIVTGVQSHVPQAMEPYGPTEARNSSIIVYGLGNLFFDQMWSWETRTELIARHTIYEGKLISTEILTAVLEDYAQPRWTTPEERVELLRRIFNAAPARP